MMRLKRLGSIDGRMRNKTCSPRMPRFVSIGTASLSALLWLATVFMWVRSSRYADVFAFRTRLTVFHAESESGHIWLEHDGFSPLFPPEHEERQRKELPYPMALRLGEETAGDFGDRWDMTVHFLGMPSTVWGAGSHWSFGGFAFLQALAINPDVQTPNTIRIIVVPYWVLLLGSGLLPLRCLLTEGLAMRSCGRRAAGRCGKCGYDLRASAGRCPECGEAKEMRWSHDALCRFRGDRHARDLLGQASLGGRSSCVP
jgi:hypothetical protein